MKAAQQKNCTSPTVQKALGALYQCADVERIDDRVGNNTFGSNITDADGGKNKREKISCQTAGITEKTLNGVSQSFLFFIHHIAHHHLEGLHGHIDRGIKEHQ